LFFAEAVRNRLEIKYIFNFCDGITTGMGHQEDSISTLYYTQYYETIRTKYHLTEYGSQYADGHLERWANEIRDYELNNPHLAMVKNEEFPASISARPYLSVEGLRINHQVPFLRLCG